jgi:probable HAF family extracellular repeat protein
MQDYTFQWLDGRRPTEAQPNATFGRDMNSQGIAVGSGWGESKPFNVNDSSGSYDDSYLHPMVWYPDHCDFPETPGPTALNDRRDMVDGGSHVLFDGSTVSLVDKFGVPDIHCMDINNHRVVTGHYGGSRYTNARAFIFNAENGGSPSDFDLLGDDTARYTSGWRINGNNHVIGYSADHTREGFLSTNSGYAPERSLTSFFYADGTAIALGDRQANALNDNDVVVGGRRSAKTGLTTAFTLKADAQKLVDDDLGVLPNVGHTYSMANDINNLGDVVGVSSTQPGQYGRAFLRTGDGSMLDLNTVIPADSGWTLDSAVRINDSGQILCQAGWSHPEFPSANGGYGFNATCILTPELHISFRPPERYIGDRYSLTAGSSGVWFGPGTRPVPINPNQLWDRDLWQQLTPEKREIMVALTVSQLSAQIGDTDARAQVEDAARKMILDAVEQWKMSST